MATATDTARDFEAYKKSTGCTCDRGEGEMHTEECPLYPQMMAGIERQEQMRQDFEKCLQRKREWDARFSHAMMMAFVFDDCTELDKMRLR